MMMAMKKKKNNNDMSIIDYLPPELKLEILSRLPVKSLLALKCVSKSWFHLISDPNFPKLHLETAAKPYTRCLHIQGYEVLSYDLDALIHNRHHEIKLSLPWPNPNNLKRVYAIGSCRGFVLLEQHPNLILWNPSTDSQTQISYSHLDSVYNSQWSCLLENTYFRGFGYDAFKDDYLVVWAWNDNRKNEDRIDFFSMRSNSWESFDFVVPKHWVIYDRSRSGILLNGALHWWSSSPSIIIVFDPIKRCFSEISIPKQFSILGTPYLLDLKGCLALYFLNKERKYEIWVMKEYKVESSWTLYGILSWKAFDLLGFSSDGDVVIGFDGDVIGFDIKTKEISRYDISGYKHSSFQFSGKYVLYRESLMSIPK